MTFSSLLMMETFLCSLFWTCQQRSIQQTYYSVLHSVSFHPLSHDFGLQDTALEWSLPYLTNRTLSIPTATPLNSLPSRSVFHKDQSLDLYSLLFIQLLFPLSFKGTLSLTIQLPMTLISRNLRPLIKSHISSSPCRIVSMTSKSGSSEQTNSMTTRP